MKKIILAMTFVLLIIVVSFVINLYFQSKTKENDKEILLYETIPEPNRKIYGSQSSTASWSEPINEVNYVVDNADSILVVRILEKENGTFIGDSAFPRSKLRVQVIETLKGKNVPDVIKITQTGGYVTLRQVLNSTTLERAEKMGITKVPESELDNTFIEYQFAGHHNLEVGKQYVVLLKGEEYSLFGNGFTIFKPTDNDSLSKTSTNKINGVVYENAITKNVLNLSK